MTAALNISHLEKLNKETLLANMDVGTSAVIGCLSGATSKVFLPQNRPLS